MRVSIIRGVDHEVTPEKFGAVGDGVSDDSQAIIDALNSLYPVRFNRRYRYTRNEDLKFYPEQGQSLSGCHEAVSAILNDREDGGDLLVTNEHGGDQNVKVNANVSIKNLSLVKSDGNKSGGLLTIKQGTWHHSIDSVRFISEAPNVDIANGKYQHGSGLHSGLKFDYSKAGMFYAGLTNCEFIGLHRSVEVVGFDEEDYGRPNEITFDKVSFKEGYNAIYIPWLDAKGNATLGLGPSGWRMKSCSSENFTGVHVYARAAHCFSIDSRFEDTVMQSWEASDGSPDTRTPVVFGDDTVYCGVENSTCFTPMAVNEVYRNTGKHGGWHSSFANRVHRERYLADDDSMLFMIRDNGQVLSQPKQTEIAYANIVEPDILFGGDTFTLSANGNVRFDRPINFENSPQINIEVEALVNCELRFKKSDYGVTALDFDVTGNSVFSFVSLTAGQVATISFRYSEKQGILLQTSNLQII